ncbi:hypothetical protein Tco_1294967 [Tanacetum coccineum]
MKNDKGKEGDEVVDKNIMETIELIENEEAINEIMDNESDGSMNANSTRWGNDAVVVKLQQEVLQLPRQST